MDLFQLAMQGKAMIMYEYYLYGSVLDNAKDGFLEILRGLCDNPENKPIEFIENEYIFSATNANGLPVTLRARHVRNPAMAAAAAAQQQQQHAHTFDPITMMGQHCHLRYVGMTDFKMDKERKTMVRNFIDCLTSSNLNDYLVALGFNLDAELIIKGYLFHKGRLKITVSKVYMIAAATGETQPMTQSNLVEISCIMGAGHESVGDDVKRFADLLKPYVRMDKQHRINEELNI